MMTSSSSLLSPRGIPWAILLCATLARSQTSQLLFDPDGNLTAQIAASIAAPQIIGQPQNQVVATNESAAFSVIVADPRQLTYQWRFNGANLSGENGVSLLLNNVGTNNEGQYQVVLTNPSGSVTSAPAMLWIDNDADGLPDSWEIGFFGNLNQFPNADADGDESSNLQELLNSTNPTNSTSVLYNLTLILDGGSVIKSSDLPGYTNGQSVTLTATSGPGDEPFHAWLGDAVSRDNPVTLVMTNNKTVFARFTPIDFVWTNSTSSDWNSPTNWDPNLVPATNDNVAITFGSIVVTLDTPAGCRDLVLGNVGIAPQLTGSGALSVYGDSLWISGTMSGSGRTIIAPGASLTIANPGVVALTSRILENHGSILWAGAGALNLVSSAVISNRAGASFEIQNTGAMNASGPNRFDNAGTFRKSVSTGTGTLNLSGSLAFNNSGAVEIQAGTLSVGSAFPNTGTVTIQSATLVCAGAFTNQGTVTLLGGSTNRMTGGGNASGTFDVPPGSLVEWTTGSFSLDPGAQLNGAGLYRINNATLTRNADLTVTNLDLVLGTLTVNGTVTVVSAMNWNGGTMSGTGRTIVPPGATLNVANPGSVGLNRTLENGGTVLWTGAGSLALNNSTFTNRAGALFDAQNGATISGSGSSRFDNAGIFRKSTNAGITTVSGLSLNNFGAVEIQAGSLNLSAGGTNGGSFDIAPGATLNLSAGTFSAGPGSSITGAGNLTVSGASATLDGLINVSGSNTFSGISGPTANLTGIYICTNNTLTISGATTANFNGTGTVAPTTLSLLRVGNGNPTLGGNNTVTILSQMDWTGGTMSGSGRTIIQPGATLNLANPSTVVLNRTLENGGTVLWTGAGGFTFNNSTFTNRAGALFHAQNAEAFSASGLCRFDNAGTFRKSISTGATTVALGIPFTNFGTVEIRSGILVANGGYVSSSNALLNCALGGTTAGTNYGQLQVAGTVTLNGSLSVDLLPGFSPATNDSFTVLTAGARNGAFANFFYPSNAVTMQMSNTPTAVVLRVTNVFSAVPPPLLLPPELIGPDVKLTWIAVSNATYRLEFNPELAISNWTALPGDVTATTNTASKLDALTPSNRLYRVRVLP